MAAQDEDMVTVLTDCKTSLKTKKKELKSIFNDMGFDQNAGRFLKCGRNVDTLRTYELCCIKPPARHRITLPGFAEEAIKTDPLAAKAKFESFCDSQFGIFWRRGLPFRLALEPNSQLEPIPQLEQLATEDDLRPQNLASSSSSDSKELNLSSLKTDTVTTMVPDIGVVISRNRSIGHDLGQPPAEPWVPSIHRSNQTREDGMARGIGQPPAPELHDTNRDNAQQMQPPTAPESRAANRGTGQPMQAPPAAGPRGTNRDNGQPMQPAAAPELQGTTSVSPAPAAAAPSVPDIDIQFLQTVAAVCNSLINRAAEGRVPDECQPLLQALNQLEPSLFRAEKGLDGRVCE
jgi:hypothetical protein